MVRLQRMEDLELLEELEGLHPTMVRLQRDVRAIAQDLINIRLHPTMVRLQPAGFRLTAHQGKPSPSHYGSTATQKNLIRNQEVTTSPSHYGSTATGSLNRSRRNRGRRLHPTMVRLQQVKKAPKTDYKERSPSHYGSTATAAPVSLHVSLHCLHPTMVRLQLTSCGDDGIVIPLSPSHYGSTATRRLGWQR